MLAFLRKIRKSLINSGSGRKYLLYAIGEIALVVIGILIALQINNGNEARKTRVLANQYRSNLILDLRADTANINRLIARAENHQQRINDYVEYFNNDRREIDSLLDSINKVDFEITRYIPVNFTFSDMQSSGKLGLLSESERRALMELAQEQELFKIVQDRNINDWFVDYQEVKKYLDMDLMTSGFHKQIGHPQDEADRIKGLMQRHHMLTSNSNINSITRNFGNHVKSMSLEALSILEI